MELKKLHMGTVAFGWDSMDEVTHLLVQALGENDLACECASKSLLSQAESNRSSDKRSTERLDGCGHDKRTSRHVFPSTRRGAGPGDLP